jgi:hypothetical protein
MLSLQLINWGQCPIQQFQTQHIQREKEEAQEPQNFDNKWEQVPSFIPLYQSSIIVASNNRDIIADKYKLKLTFGKKLFSCIQLKDVLFMSSSEDGNIVVIDTSMNEVLVFFLSETGEMKSIGSRSFNAMTKSIVDSTSLICFSYTGTNGIVWDFSRGSTLFEIAEDAPIIEAVFLEEDFSLAVLTAANLTIYTCNNLIIERKDFSVAATCFCRTDTGFVVGFGDGTTQIIAFDRITCSFDTVITSCSCLSPIISISYIDGTVYVATSAKSFHRLK